MSTRDKIIQIALKHFCRYGYKETSLADLAKEVGITKPSLYHHFESKEALFGTVLEYFFGLWEGWTGAFFRPEISLREALKKWLTSFAALDRQLSDLVGDTEAFRFGIYYLIFDGIRIFPEFDQIFQTNNQRMIGMISAKVTEAIERGEIRNDIDLGTVFQLVGALLEGIHVLKVLNPALDADALGGQSFELVWKSLEA